MVGDIFPLHWPFLPGTTFFQYIQYVPINFGLYFHFIKFQNA